MIDLRALDATIAQAASGKAAAVVTRPWLEQVRKDLRELADRRAREARA